MRVLILLFGLSCVSVNLAAQTERQVPYRLGVKLVDQLLPGERSLTVKKVVSPLRAEFPTNVSRSELLDFLTLRSEAVFVARFTEKREALTDEADWIMTRYAGVAQQQLKPVGDRNRRLSRIEILTEGGKLSLGGATITAVADWERHFEIGIPYLLFAAKFEEGPSDIWASYRIAKDGKLESMLPDFYSEGATGLGGMLLNEAAKVIANAVRSQAH